MSVTQSETTSNRDTLAASLFWLGLFLGVASGALFRQCYRIAIESLKIGSAPDYAWIVAPATILTGAAGALASCAGLRHSRNTQRHAIRFKAASLFAANPTVILILARLS